MYLTTHQRRSMARSRGGFRTRSTGLQQQSELPDLPLGSLITTLRIESLEQDRSRFDGEARISDSRYVTSFNWLSNSPAGPTIVVPGEPPIWTPPVTHTKLKEDSGDYYRDQNAARFPKHPVEPTVIALLSTEPDLVADVDLFVCGSTFGNLLKFVQGSAKRFRILIELIGETVFFVRRERSATETIQDIHGYGHAFPQAYTTWSAQMKRSESHQRVIKYDFARLTVLMRYEGDGYLSQQKNWRGSVRATNQVHLAEPVLSHLVAELASTRVADAQMAVSGILQVHTAGVVVPQKQTFDLKTRGLWKKADDILGEELSRLWARQIPNFILAFHQKGVFSDAEIHIQDVEQDLSEWEDDNQADLVKFAALLHKLIALVRVQPSGRIEVCYAEGLGLEIRQQLPDVGAALSEEVRARWLDALPQHAGGVALAVPAMNSNFSGEEDRDDDDNDADYTACDGACGYCGTCSH